MEISTFMTKICLLKPTLEIFVLRFPLDEEQSDQLVQDTLIKALLEADTYPEAIPLKQWLFSLMKSVHADTYVHGPMKLIHSRLESDVPLGLSDQKAFNELSEMLDQFDHDLESHEQNLFGAEPVMQELKKSV